MSIRMLAVELYRVKKEVEALEKKFRDLPPGAPDRDEVEQQLRSARAEEVRLRSMMEGAKEP